MATEPMTDLQVHYLPIVDLLPYARNMNQHSDEHVAELAASIKEFGFRVPLLVDKDNVLVAGHGRVLAARKVGLARLPCIRCDDMTETQVRAYRIADNRLPKNADVDIGMLSLELVDLKGLDFDLGLLGFDSTELDALLNPEVPPEEGLTDPDAVPEVTDTRCKPGDLWQLGDHRLLCGDSTDVLLIERLMVGEKADMVFTDPPYGMGVVKKQGMLHGAGIKGACASGIYRPIAGDDSTKTAIDSFNLCSSLGIKTLVFWGANFYAEVLPPSSGWICWDKENGDDFFADGELAWTNTDRQLRIFHHQWKGMIKASERGERRVHPTQKPIALAEWTFEKYDREGKSVLDLFLGSGSTLIACEKTSRRCFGMEIDPHYCDVILKRWEDFTGLQAELLPASENAVD